MESKREVVMLCPTCGGTDFAVDECQIERVKCVFCSVEMSVDELTNENAENINMHLEELVDEIVRDEKKHVIDSLKKSLRHNTNIRIG